METNVQVNIEIFFVLSSNNHLSFPYTARVYFVTCASIRKSEEYRFYPVFQCMQTGSAVGK